MNPLSNATSSPHNMIASYPNDNYSGNSANVITPLFSSARSNNNPRPRSPTSDEMHAVFAMCRQNQWNSVLYSVRSNPMIPTTLMIMDNHISTTILHQAITSKGDTKARRCVILEILAVAPEAASIKNGYGSLPLHVIAQRNTKMDAPTKELLIKELVNAYTGALVQQGGVGKRTPLHIIFTDYISPRLTEMMIQHGRAACFMKDKKGYLPVHVACSRHCSPEKLQMLLQVYPGALREKTNDGQTLLSLAQTTATKSHPNYALIDDLKQRLRMDPQDESVAHAPPSRRHRVVRVRCSSEDSSSTQALCEEPFLEGSTSRRRRRKAASCSKNKNKKRCSTTTTTTTTDHPDDSLTTSSIVDYSNDRKRKVTVDEMDDPATLLLHFSRHQSDKKPKLIAKV